MAFSYLAEPTDQDHELSDDANVFWYSLAFGRLDTIVDSRMFFKANGQFDLDSVGWKAWRKLEGQELNPFQRQKQQDKQYMVRLREHEAQSLEDRTFEDWEKSASDEELYGQRTVGR